MEYWIDERSEIYLSKFLWDFSRPSNKYNDIPLSDILKVDAPVNEMPTVTMRIKSTIIEREIIASLRDHTMWAQGSRVEDPTQFRVPEQLYQEFPILYDNIRERMVELKESGMRQDEFRLKLPVFAYTNYSVKLNLRSLVKLAKYFETLSTQFSKPVNSLFASSSRTLWHVVHDFTGALHRSVMGYKPINLTPEIERTASGRIGDFITVTLLVPFTLRTHLVRHRSLMIVDGINDFIKERGVAGTIGDFIEVQVCGSVDAWNSVLSKRSCWMAHYGVWSDLIYMVNSHIPDPQLPCSDGTCPYTADAELRYTDADPNPPCPIHAVLYGKEITKAMENEMSDLIDRDGRSCMFWEKLREACNR